MIPAALELLMRRLEVWDRKALHGAAMICAEVWNAAEQQLDREQFPEGISAKYFLAELPEERARRIAEEAAEEEAARTRPINKAQFDAFKAGLMALTKKPGV